jgi:hypothetical protein
MFSIKPEKQTVTTYSLTIVLQDEDEINRFLVDPAPLQKQVRAARNQLYGHKPAGRGAAEKKSASRQTRRGRPSGSRKAIEREPCASCGVLIAAYRQGRHKCKSVADVE